MKISTLTSAASGSRVIGHAAVLFGKPATWQSAL
jgi:hypothetical protein